MNNYCKSDDDCYTYCHSEKKIYVEYVIETDRNNYYIKKWKILIEMALVIILLLIFFCYKSRCCHTI